MDIYEYFLGSSSSDVLVETYEISHPNFSQTYRVVKNVTTGVTVTTEVASGVVFDYYPLRTSRIKTSDNLDSAIDFNIGDQGAIIAAEIDQLRASGGMTVKPTITYRGYSSADYTQMIEGPFILEINDSARNVEGAAFQATPPKLNTLRTGERYTPDRFPLGGFL
jgi:hypothetical protein